MGKTTGRPQGRSKAKAKAGKKIEAINRAKQETQGSDTQDEIELKIRNLEWIMARVKADQVPIYTMDIETDPFKRGQVPVPFIIGFYDGLDFRSFETDRQSTCIEKMRWFLQDQKVDPGIIYMHNGGRFDFYYMLEWFEGKTTIINSRIVQALMPLGTGKNRFDKWHRFEFRDSYALMPFPLRAYKKDDIAIDLLDKKVRHLHMEKIRSYLKGDCVYLWDLCMGFQREFGDYKTIASAAFAQLNSFHHYEQLPLRQDEEIRSKFYFGGRVQCFSKGVVEAPVSIYDVNSMYPFVMDTCFHPTSWVCMEDQKIHGWTDAGELSPEKTKTFFLTVEGEAFEPAPFPVRKKDGSVEFPAGQGVYHVSIHEWFTALNLGLFKPTRILNAYSFNDYACFHLFVSHFYQARERCKKEFAEHKRQCERCAGSHSFGQIKTEASTQVDMCSVGLDLHAHNLYYKYILNSAYGKFGLNPENYFNWEISKTATEPKGKFWQLDSIVQDKYYVWKQPSQLFWNVKNIATAASITGAARSILLRAVAESKNVLYCDTDSIICQEFAGGKIDEKTLGAWKLEATGTQAAIAGKKMYAVFDANGDCIKQANKGVDLTPQQILGLCRGEEVLSMREAPTFKRDGSATFISRTVRMT